MMGPDEAAIVGILTVCLLLARVLGGVMVFFGLPRTFGEILAGMLLGSWLGRMIPQNAAWLKLLAELGALFLMFRIGLGADLRRLSRVALLSFVLAMVGGMASCGLIAFAVWRVIGASPLASFGVGVVFAATSVSLSARIVAGQRHSDTTAWDVVLGAAVLDDLLGISLFTILTTVVMNQNESLIAGLPAALMAWLNAALVVAASLVFGKTLVPLLVRAGAELALRGRESPSEASARGDRRAYARGYSEESKRIQESKDTLAMESLIAISVLLMLGLAWFISLWKLSLLIGAFLAGMIMGEVNPAEHREDEPESRTLAWHFARLEIFTPLFFLNFGASLDLNGLDGAVLLWSVMITALALLGKLIGAWSLGAFPGGETLGLTWLGWAMSPRGEVALIVTQWLWVHKVCPPRLHAAVILSVILTALVGPVFLRWAHPRKTGLSESLSEDLGETLALEAPRGIRGRIQSVMRMCARPAAAVMSDMLRLVLVFPDLLRLLLVKNLQKLTVILLIWFCCGAILWFTNRDLVKVTFPGAMYDTFMMLLLDASEYADAEVDGQPNPSYAINLMISFLIPMIGVLFIGTILADMGHYVFSQEFSLDRNVLRSANQTGHVIVAGGAGSLGVSLIRATRKRVRGFVVVDLAPQHLQSVLEDADEVPVISGSTRDEEILHKANLREAAALMLVTQDDLANLDGAFTAQKIAMDCNPNLRIALLVHDDELARRPAMRALVGGGGEQRITLISPMREAAWDFLAAATGRQIIQEWDYRDVPYWILDDVIQGAEGRSVGDLAALVRRETAERASATGIAESSPGQADSFRIVETRREGQGICPEPDPRTVLERGDQVLLVMTRDELAAWERINRGPETRRMIVLGGGEYAIAVVRGLLWHGDNVTLIAPELRSRRHQELARAGCQLIENDVNDRDVLTTAKLPMADAVVIALDHDLQNLSTAFLARELNVRPDARIVVQLFDDTFADKLDALARRVPDPAQRLFPVSPLRRTLTKLIETATQDEQMRLLGTCRYGEEERFLVQCALSPNHPRSARWLHIPIRAIQRKGEIINVIAHVSANSGALTWNPPGSLVTLADDTLILTMTADQW